MSITTQPQSTLDLEKEQIWNTVTLLETCNANVSEFTRVTKMLSELEDSDILNWFLKVDIPAYNQYMATGKREPYLHSNDVISFGALWNRFKYLLQKDGYKNARNSQSGIIYRLLTYFSIPALTIDNEVLAEESKERGAA